MSSPTTNWRTKDSVRNYLPVRCSAVRLPAETDGVLDLQHHIFFLTYRGRLGLCPKNDRSAKVHRVLDVGSGTGSWAVEFGTQLQPTLIFFSSNNSNNKQLKNIRRPPYGTSHPQMLLENSMLSDRTGGGS